MTLITNLTRNLTSSLVFNLTGDKPLVGFISTWKTDNAGTSNDNQILLPLESSGTYNFLVDWGDGNQDTITVWNQAETTHTYSASGTFTITITGTINGWKFDNGGDRQKILKISNWGTLLLGNGNNYFQGASNLIITATDILDTLGMTNMGKAFAGCPLLTTIPSINLWNFSTIDNMFEMFLGSLLFNQSLNGLDVSNVINLIRTFENTSFNQDISSLDFSNVNSLSGTFRNTPFNQDISSSNFSNKINNMSRTFENTPFNQDISSLDVSNVTIMFNMLAGSAFTQVNYDLLLVAWDALTLQSNVLAHFGTAKFGAGAPATARSNIITNDLWTITDGGAA